MMITNDEPKHQSEIDWLGSGSITFEWWNQVLNPYKLMPPISNNISSVDKLIYGITFNHIVSYLTGP